MSDILKTTDQEPKQQLTDEQVETITAAVSAAFSAGIGPDQLQAVLELMSSDTKAKLEAGLTGDATGGLDALKQFLEKPIFQIK